MRVIVGMWQFRITGMLWRRGAPSVKGQLT
jgi:hypothetical protein